MQRSEEALCDLLAGLVIKPLDLLTFDKAHQRVMEHAFGRMLIAADADTAARLATRYGLASVTLAGRISRPGSLQGGWQGAAPRTQTAAAVLELSLVQVRRAAPVLPQCDLETISAFDNCLCGHLQLMTPRHLSGLQSCGVLMSPDVLHRQSTRLWLRSYMALRGTPGPCRSSRGSCRQILIPMLL